MKLYFILLFSFILSVQSTLDAQVILNARDEDKQEKQEWAIIIHGGAGGMQPQSLSEKRAAQYKSSLEKALSRGSELLDQGIDGIDVVEQVIELLENDSSFNAGRGAVLNSQGQAEMDASIMDGESLNAGAVAGVKRIKNPIKAARLVMDSSRHVMLSGQAAEEYCIPYGLDTANQRYFITQKAKQALKRARAKEKVNKSGTVGVVVLDREGHIAAGTSTGGMTNKRYGRVGDSPIIGAGTYADDNTCGVSCTGHGEMYIRLAVAHDIHAMMAYTDLSLQEAVDIVIEKKLPSINGTGGIIALDKYGNIAYGFNTSSMLRAYATPEKREVEIFRD
ncbi:MAG TPA: isoaspartyl peptidase/L-asparaginase [Saprospiraceae bacterium]|nr:isoaspartyl peptidase/L-asparaginase [Saprospiraceae bacterium]